MREFYKESKIEGRTTLIDLICGLPFMHVTACT